MHLHSSPAVYIHLFMTACVRTAYAPRAHAALMFAALACLACARAAAVPPMGAEPLLTAAAVRDVTWLSDSSALAVNTDRALVLVEAHGPRVLSGPDAVLSPDGKSILFADAQGRLRAMDAGSGAVTDLGLYGAAPRWAPEGRRFAYIADGRCAPGAEAWFCPPAGLVAADMSAGELVPLAQGAGADGGYDWLPGASGVVYYSRGELGIARADAATNSLLTKVAPFPCPESNPCPASVAVARHAPRAAVFLFNDRNGDRAWDAGDAAALWAFDTDTGDIVHTEQRAWFLNPEELRAGLRPRGIAWRPDGGAICFTGRDETGFYLMFHWFTGEAPPTLLRMQGRPELPRWSPDGQAVAFVLVRQDSSSSTGTMSELRLLRFSDNGAPGAAR